MNKSIVVIDDHPITENDFMSSIDNELISLHETGDINHVMKVVDGLDKIDRIAGQAKAKLLWGANEWWKSNRPSENFIDYIESFTSMKPVVVDRYITVWKYIHEGAIPEEIQVFPMRDLIPIAKALSQGYELNESTIKSLVKATSSSEIGSILRTVKNKPARKSSLQITWDRKGSLYAWKDGQRHFIGMLDKEGYATDEVVKQAINRILDNAGVQKK